jgi:acetyl esterase/lipase
MGDGPGKDETLTLDPQARRFLALLNATSREQRSALEVSDLRCAAASLATFSAPAPDVVRHDDALSDGARSIPIRSYSPKGLASVELPGLVWFHGGGWVSGSLDGYDALCATLCDLGACRVIAIEYRLAPESRYPAAHQDALAAMMGVMADPGRWSLDARRVGIGGDSAGGGLAAAAAREACDRGISLALQLLLCPVLDPLGRTASRRELAKGHLIEEAILERYWDLYRVEGLASDDPRVSPLSAEFVGLPPTLIHTAEYDPLRDEGALYARALESAGVRVRHTEHAGLIHHFYGLGAVIPAARTALSRVGEELREAFAAAANPH